MDLRVLYKDTQMLDEPDKSIQGAQLGIEEWEGGQKFLLAALQDGL